MQQRLALVIAALVARAQPGKIAALVSGDVVVAIITNEAVTDLALKEGSEVVAIIKSTDVMIAK